MAGILGFDIDIAGITNTVLGSILWVFIGIIVILFAIFMLWLMSHNHTFIRRNVVSGRKKIDVKKYKEVVDKDGVPWYKVLGIKGMVPTAPPEAIEITAKGKNLVECYFLDGEYIYLKDNCAVLPEEITTLTDQEIERIPPDITRIPDKKRREQEIQRWADAIIKHKVDAWKKEHEPIKAYQPFTTKQRALQVSQLRSAQKWKKKNLWEHITTIASLAALTILVIALMVFYADMAKPLMASMDKYNQNVLIQKESLEIIKEIKQDIQVIGEDELVEATGPPPD